LGAARRLPVAAISGVAPLAEEVGKLVHRIQHEQVPGGHRALAAVHRMAGGAADFTAASLGEVAAEIPVPRAGALATRRRVGRGVRGGESGGDLERDLRPRRDGRVDPEDVVAGAVLLPAAELGVRRVAGEADLLQIGAQEGAVAVFVGVVAAGALHALALHVGQAQHFAEQSLVPER
jgi:hypothetical protein